MKIEKISGKYADTIQYNIFNNNCRSWMAYRNPVTGLNELMYHCLHLSKLNKDQFILIIERVIEIYTYSTRNIITEDYIYESPNYAFKEYRTDPSFRHLMASDFNRHPKTIFNITSLIIL